MNQDAQEVIKAVWEDRVRVRWTGPASRLRQVPKLDKSQAQGILAAGLEDASWSAGRT